jgi:hypothetical protein
MISAMGFHCVAMVFHDATMRSAIVDVRSLSASKAALVLSARKATL